MSSPHSEAGISMICVDINLCLGSKLQDTKPTGIQITPHQKTKTDESMLFPHFAMATLAIAPKMATPRANKTPIKYI